MDATMRSDDEGIRRGLAGCMGGVAGGTGKKHTFGGNPGGWRIEASLAVDGSGAAGEAREKKNEMDSSGRGAAGRQQRHADGMSG